MLTTVDVVIATLGRLSLIEVIEGIREDSLGMDISLRFRVFIDNASPSEELIDWLTLQQDVEWLLSSADRRLGAGGAFNVALSMVKSDIFCIFSDDDEWCQGRLRSMTDLLRTESNALLIQRVSFGTRNGRDIRPDFSLIDPERILFSLLAPTPPYRRSTRTVSLLGVSATANLAAISFDPALQAYEDMWWLHEATSSVLKPKVILHDSVAAHAIVDPKRTSSRLSEHLIDVWLDRLAGVDLSLVRDFEWEWFPRILAAAGDFPNASFRHHRFRTTPNRWGHPRLLCYALIALAIRASKVLSR